MLKETKFLCIQLTSWRGGEAGEAEPAGALAQAEAESRPLACAF